MKKVIIILLTLTLLSNCQQTKTEELLAQNQVLDTNKVIEPLEYHPQINKMVTRILLRYHYKKFDLNDSLSSVIFDLSLIHISEPTRPY